MEISSRKQLCHIWHWFDMPICLFIYIDQVWDAFQNLLNRFCDTMPITPDTKGWEYVRHYRDQNRRSHLSMILLLLNLLRLVKDPLQFFERFSRAMSAADSLALSILAAKYLSPMIPELP